MSSKNSFKGVVPTVKSFFLGSESLSHRDYNHEQNGVSTFSYHTSNFSFSHKGLKHLVKTGYVENPVGFSVINKISLSQKELVITPYSDGEPLQNESIPFDINKLFFYQILTGTGALWVRNIPIVGKVYDVINPLYLVENCVNGILSYVYINDGLEIKIPESDIIFFNDKDILKENTNLGLCPLRASLMPMDSLSKMYVADASLLDNKGADVLITNGSDTPITGTDSDEMDSELNRRYAGAKKHGKLITSTAKLDVHTIGRTTKELALWDGYKIKLRDIANVFGLSSSHFNDPENKKYANFNEARKELYTNCVIPHTRTITENKELIDELGYELFIDTSGVDVLQQDQEVRANKNKVNQEAIIQLNEKVQLGIITRDIAIQILITEWNYDEEEARNYIGERDKREVTEGDE